MDSMRLIGLIELLALLFALVGVILLLACYTGKQTDNLGWDQGTARQEDSEENLCAFRSSLPENFNQAEKKSVLSGDNLVNVTLFGHLHHDFNVNRRHFEHVFLPLAISSVALNRVKVEDGNSSDYGDNNYNLTLKQSNCIDLVLKLQAKRDRSLIEVVNINAKLRGLAVGRGPAREASSEDTEERECNIDYPGMLIESASLEFRSRKSLALRCLSERRADANQVTHHTLVTMRLSSLEIKLNDFPWLA